jgi:mannose-6-phosphate isomerase-like protein (cupin superfamily)
MAERESLVIRASDASDLGRTDGGSFRLVQREQLRLGELSVGLSDNPPGSGVEGLMHRHSCGEVFVVFEGRGIYTVEDTDIVAGPGDMVVVPPNIWHSFRPEGDNCLRHVAVYDAGSVDIEVSTRPGDIFQM